MAKRRKKVLSTKVPVKRPSKWTEVEVREAGRKRWKKKKQRAAGPGPIEIRTVTRWRNKKTGKIVPFAKRKGAARETISQQVTAKGRVLRSIGFTTKDEVVRTVVKGMIAESGSEAGLIAPALQRTNITSPSSLKGARRMVVKVSGTGPDGRHESFKFDIDQHTVRKRRRVLKSVLLSMILSEMRLRSWRTWYPIKQIDWTKRHRTTLAHVKKMVPMRDMEISVRVLR